MAYKNLDEIYADDDYMDELLDDDEMSEYGRDGMRYFITAQNKKKIAKVWVEKMQAEFEETKTSKTHLGKFIQQYGLSLREVLVLLHLPSAEKSRSEIFIEDDKYDPFKKFAVRYESSRLRKHKLVFRIINPLIPIKTNYVAAYRAHLGLLGKEYTDEYQQLDIGLEEESKRNSPDELESLYYCVTPKIKLSELIVDDATLTQLRTALSRENNRSKIFKRWGFDSVLDYGKGTTLNFRGPPGTGKTMAAHCLASELGRKLLIVRYDQLQNMFIGQTEKNIQAAFKIAKVKNAILFFDEADAIALSRVTLERSWEMSQVNTLLKELERFEGVCIFATNFAEKYDKAFERRLTMHIDFKLPDEAQAKKIFDYVIPKKARDKALSLDSFSLEGFSGGDLKNIALNAAGVATRENSPKIMTQHVAEAIAMARKTKEKETGWNKWYMG